MAARPSLSFIHTMRRKENLFLPVSLTQTHFTFHSIFSLLSQENKETGRKLFIATGCMFTLPILVYFLCYSFLFSEKQQPENWAGFSAIVTVNVIIGIYVWSAFNEEEEETRMAPPPPKSHKVRTD